MFLWVRVVIYPSKKLKMDFRKFWAKTNDQSWSYTPKFAKICQNQLKMAKIYPFRSEKNPKFWIFPQIPLLIHARRHLGEDFRKFWAKTNDKISSYKSKTFKKLDFWPKCPFFDSFWPKMANFWIFFKNPLGTFFYIPKALSNCQVSEKTNERMSRYLRDARTYVHTRVNL